MSNKNFGANKMGTQKMLPLILSMALPSMFSMLVQALYNIVDSFYVSSYDPDALSAVTLAFPIQNILIGLSVGTAIGAGSLISRKLGEKNIEFANKTASTGMVLSVLTSIPFVFFGLFFTRPFLLMFESNENIISMGMDYLSITSIFSCFVFVQIAGEKILQSTGNMIWPMILQLIGAITNILLDPVFIFGYFGIPEMGALGAGIATVIGQFVAAVITLIVMFKQKHEVVISFKGFKFEKSVLIGIYKVAIPTAVMSSIASIMVMALNAILATFSTAAYTVLGIFTRMQSFVLMPVFGLSNGLMPILGYNYGARNKKRLMSALKIGIILALIINTTGTAIFMIFPSELLSIFNATPEIYEIGIPAMRISSVYFITAAIGIIISTMFQAVGRGMYSLISSLLRQLFVIVPLAYFLSKISLTAFWYAFPVAEIIAMIAIFYFFFKVYKNEIKPMGDT